VIHSVLIKSSVNNLQDEKLSPDRVSLGLPPC
jgi:hypothetical protein